VPESVKFVDTGMLSNFPTNVFHRTGRRILRMDFDMDKEDQRALFNLRATKASEFLKSISWEKYKINTRK